MKTDAETTLIERLKELNCLLRISKLLAQHDVDLELILKQTVEILPQAFQSPEQTCARIIYQGTEYVSKNFHLEPDFLQEPIQIKQNTAGFVEVYFISEQKGTQINSFLTEEQTLLSAIADQISMVISKKEAEQSLHTTLAKLQENSIQLENKNIALKELLHQIQSERERSTRVLRTQIEGSVLPALNRILKNAKDDPDIREYVRIAQESLDEIQASSAVKNTQETTSLSPRELEVCSMIKRGLSTKEICLQLGLSIQTVEKHRYNIRKKFGIANKKINLSVFLRDY